MARSVFSLPREGLYIDPLFTILKATIYSPPLLLVLSVLTRASFKRHIRIWWSSWHLIPLPTLAEVSLLLIFLGVCLRTHNYLNRRHLNGFVTDKTWDWSKERVLVTGGSSGIGASVIQQLLERSLKTEVIVIDFRPLQLAVPSGAKLHFYQCDLSDSAAIKVVSERIRTDHGPPSVLINNAGLTPGRTVMEGSYQDVETTFKTNIIAPFLLTKEFLPSMVENDHGHIVATASMSAIISPGCLADYAATKAGIIALQETLRQELGFIHKAPRVRTSTVVLGFVQTPMFKGSTNQPHFLSPLINVDTVGEAIVDALYSAESQNIWLPGLNRVLAFLRGGLEWLMEVLRNGTRKLDVDYVGYQRIDSGTGILMTPNDT